MAFPFAAVAGAVLPKLVGGIIGNNDAKRQRSRQLADIKRDRYFFGRDRRNEREYQAQLTAKDRKYAENITAKDRRYAEKRLADERAYARELRRVDRAHAGAVFERDRRLFEKDRKAHEVAFKADRDNMQARSDRYARMAAETRGLDFKALRDDAVKAGFNPLTALQFATSYSTEVGYHNAGSIYPGYGGGAPGGAVVPSSSAGSGAVPGTPIVPSAYQSPGVGYASTPAPAFASNQFLADALGAGIETYFNARAVEDEETYRSIERQVAMSHLQRLLGAENPYQDFGFRMPKSEPFSADVGFGGGELTAPFGGRVPQGPGSDASQFENRYGEIAGEVAGAGNLVATGDKWLSGLSWRDLFYSDGSVFPENLPPGAAAAAATGSRPRAPALQLPDWLVVN